MTVKRMIGTRIGNLKTVSALALCAVGLLGSACSASELTDQGSFTPDEQPSTETPATPVNPKGSGETVAVKIDNSKGGEVALSDGTKIEVPAGALPEGVEEISVTSSPEAAPAEYKTVSPVFVFGPDGTVFLKPLKVTLPFTAPPGTDTTKLTVLWSRPSGPGFDMVPTQFSASSTGYSAAAEVTHFSQGVVGEKFTTDPNPAKDPYADK